MTSPGRDGSQSDGRSSRKAVAFAARKSRDKCPIFKTIDQKLIEATKANGGTYVRNPLWSTILRNQLLTVHPLGGCPMGEDAQSGVVDHKGQVFSSDAGTATHHRSVCRGRFDSPVQRRRESAADDLELAERIMSLIAEDHRWEIDYRLPSALE